MLVSRFKTVLTLVLAVSAVGAGVALVSDRVSADEKPAQKAPTAPSEAQNGEKLKALLTERRTSAEEQFNAWQKKVTGVLRRNNERQARFPPAAAAANRQVSLELSLDSLRLSDAQAHLYLWAKRLLNAELELCDKQAERVAAYERYLIRVKASEKVFKEEAKNAEADVYVAAAKFHRLDAEIMLERAKAK